MFQAAQTDAAHFSNIAEERERCRHQAAIARIDRLIARIDAVLSAQVNAILLHPDVQGLEARWRGLEMLVRQTAGSREILVKVLDVSWADLSRDLSRAGDFDQSRVFDLIYSQEFGMPGGEPFGVLVGDYRISPITDSQRGDQCDTLRQMAAVAAAAFAPFLVGAAPDALGVADFSDLAGIPEPELGGTRAERIRWDALRDHDDAHFVGLVAPELRVRGPRAEIAASNPHGFCLTPNHDALLWMNGAFGVALAVCRAFADYGWLASIVGTPENGNPGGRLTSIAPHDFGTDRHGLSAQSPVSVRLSPTQELVLADLGVIPIATTDLHPEPVLNTCPTLKKPASYDSVDARQNAKLAGMLNYVLCASRFAHFLKVIIRDEVGSIEDEQSLQQKLSNWLNSYCIGNDDADADFKARFPLRSAGVSVRTIPGRPGAYACQIRLQPHYQLDHIETSFHLVAESVDPTTTSGRAA